MKQKTWEYGTKIPVKVTNAGKVVLAVVATDGSNEGFILIGSGQRPPIDEVGFITFTKGGPTGGYWHYDKK